MSYTLYDYFRSTASYRVRIVLELKKISYETKEIHLVNNGGEQTHENYTQINPQKLVPTLIENKSSFSITQSLAIIDYLDSVHSTPSIYSLDTKLNAQIKSTALSIACDIHPLNNLRVLTYLEKELKMNKNQKIDWYHHWLHEGFTALETQLSTISRKKLFCFSDNITLADICLIPQWYNAQRFNLELKAYPTLRSINDHCLTLAPFEKAAPHL